MSDLSNIAREVFANDLFATKITGVTINKVDKDMAVCHLSIASSHLNAKGAVMGGALFTLADFAMAIAANSDALAEAKTSQEVNLRWVTTSSTIHYLSAPSGEKLQATASIVKRGHNVLIGQVNITDSADRKVALITTEMLRM